jgi:hypothetical protein
MSAQLIVSEELDVPPEIAFARLCAVETWPVWMSFVKRTTVNPAAGPLRVGTDIHVWSDLNRGAEEIYEVDEVLEPYTLVLVGAYSLRRRIEFRIERQLERARMTIRICYHIHGGALSTSIDRMTLRRKLGAALAQSVETFKGLVEHDAADMRERALV